MKELNVHGKLEVTKPRPIRRSVVVGALISAALGQFYRTPSALADSKSDQIAIDIDKLEAEANRTGLLTVPPRRRRERLTGANVYMDGLPRVLQISDAASTRQDMASMASISAELIARLNDYERSPSEYFSRRPRGPAPRYEGIKADYERMFSACKILPQYKQKVDVYEERLAINLPRYQQVGDKIKVPWFVVGIIHAREASFNFGAHLHNGDRHSLCRGLALT